MARKIKFDYFDCFNRISACATEYAEKLNEYLDKLYESEVKGEPGDPEDAAKLFYELHNVEERADGIVHEILARLAGEFVTPIEREDILAMATSLDNVVDYLDEIPQRLYMYNVRSVPLEAIDMMHVVRRAVEAMGIACEKFSDYKKTGSIKEYVDKVGKLEDEGDLVYIKAMHEIYLRAGTENALDRIDAIGIGSVLGALEKCCDACEAVADSIVMVVMKNS